MISPLAHIHPATQIGSNVKIDPFAVVEEGVIIGEGTHIMSHVVMKKKALFGGGGANFSRPEWTLPPGYNSKEANRRLARQATDYGFLGLTSEKLKQSGEDDHHGKDTRARLRRGEVSIEEAKRK